MFRSQRVYPALPWTLIAACLLLILSACGDATATTAASIATTAPASATTAPAIATAAATTAPVAMSPSSATTAPAPANATTAPALSATPTTSNAVDKLIGKFVPDMNGKKGGSVVFGYAGQSADSLNPYFQNSAADATVVGLIYDPVLGVNDKGQYFPDLVTDVPTTLNGGVTVSPDKKTMDVTVKMKPNIVWSDGQPITSKDIKFTINWILDKNQVGVTTDGFDRITSVDTPDDSTAIFHFNQVFAPYLNFVSFTPLPEHVWSKIPVTADINKNPEALSPTVVSGAFTVKNADFKNRIELVRNEKYTPVFGHNAYLDSVIYQATASTDAAVASALKNEIDALENLQETDIATVAGKPNIQVTGIPAYSYELLLLNTSDPILSDLNVRTALDYAIDRNAILKQTLTPTNQVLAGTVSPLSFAYDNDLQPITQDFGKASQLLEAAGWKLGGDGIRVKDGKRLSLTISATAGNTRRENTEQILASYFKQIGLELKIQNYPKGPFYAAWADDGIIKHGRFQIALEGLIGSADPDGDYANWHSSQIPTEANKGNGQNNSYLVDPILDKALDDQRSTVDFTERAKYWKTFQEEFQKVRPALPLFTRLVASINNPKLANYKPNPTQVGNEWNAVDWYLK